jgi:hypothetical protein
MNYTCIARKMVELPSISHYTFAQEILRSIAKLAGTYVKEVFQSIARMLQISSVVLDRMVGLLSDMFEDSKTFFFRIKEDEPPIARLPNCSVNLMLGVQ